MDKVVGRSRGLVLTWFEISCRDFNVGSIFFASFGNILGSIVNWFLGLYITKFINKSWFPFSKKQLDKASSWYLKYGKWSLFLSWVPFVGDPLTIVAGMFRVPLIIFITIVSISKILRYIFVGYIALKLL